MPLAVGGGLTPSHRPLGRRSPHPPALSHWERESRSLLHVVGLAEHGPCLREHTRRSRSSCSRSRSILLLPAEPKRGIEHEHEGDSRRVPAIRGQRWGSVGRSRPAHLWTANLRDLLLREDVHDAIWPSSSSAMDWGWLHGQGQESRTTTRTIGRRFRIFPRTGTIPAEHRTPDTEHHPTPAPRVA